MQSTTRERKGSVQVFAREIVGPDGRTGEAIWIGAPVAENEIPPPTEPISVSDYEPMSRVGVLALVAFVFGLGFAAGVAYAISG